MAKFIEAPQSEEATRFDLFAMVDQLTPSDYLLLGVAVAALTPVLVALYRGVLSGR